jgi:predicted DNA-binding protein (MmcQ/YjbR family)
VTIDEIKAYCLHLSGATYDFPFDDETCVFRVGGKMFGLMGIHADPPRINLKCDPILARDLRSAFESIVPGYHMNKEHWNTVLIGGDVPDDKVRWLIDHSYDLIRSKLPRSRQP